MEKRDRMLRKALITKVLKTEKWGVERWRQAVQRLKQAKWIYQIRAAYRFRGILLRKSTLYQVFHAWRRHEGKQLQARLLASILKRLLNARKATALKSMVLYKRPKTHQLVTSQ